jgi:hypothetical protein
MSWPYRILIAAVVAVLFQSAASFALAKSDGEKWGDECLQSGPGSLSAAQQCCEKRFSAKNEFCDVWKPLKYAERLCAEWLRICNQMMDCDDKLNACKKSAMQTDTNCSTETCKKCTENYKICHDKAVEFHEPPK